MAKPKKVTRVRRRERKNRSNDWIYINEFIALTIFTNYKMLIDYINYYLINSNF